MLSASPTVRKIGQNIRFIQVLPTKPKGHINQTLSRRLLKWNENLFSKKPKPNKSGGRGVKWEIVEALTCSPKERVNPNQKQSVLKVQLSSGPWFIILILALFRREQVQFGDWNALFSTQKKTPFMKKCLIKNGFWTNLIWLRKCSAAHHESSLSLVPKPVPLWDSQS